MIRLLGSVLALVVVLVGAVAGYFYYYMANQPDPTFWEGDIQRFEAANQDAGNPTGQVIFIGSSSIRFWATLETDFAPLPVVNRGFGGSMLPHVAHFAPRIVTPLAPAAVVIYAGDNDFGGLNPKSTEAVLEDFRAMLAYFDEALPTTPIYYLSIKPSLLRWESWPKIAAANATFSEIADAHPRLTFVDVSTPMLGADGRPREDLFWYDGLHIDEDGYTLWTAILKPLLVSALPSTQRSKE
ncbi:MAG: GDSL-type esterase/lipase family protein [Parvibaculum sp.]